MPPCVYMALACGTQGADKVARELNLNEYSPNSYRNLNDPNCVGQYVFLSLDADDHSIVMSSTIKYGKLQELCAYYAVQIVE